MTTDMMKAGAVVSGRSNGSGGAIYDIGYRTYDGPRFGRWFAVRSLIAHSLRSIFGFGRGGRAKLAPFALLAFAVVPAIIQSGIASATGNVLIVFAHETYFTTISVIFALFVASQAPELIGGDHQHRVLTLYFARALGRLDYILAKYTALVIALLIVGITPHLVLLLGRVFVNESPWTAFRGDAHLLVPIVAGALIIALLFSAIGLVVAAVTPRRFYATAAIIGMLLLTRGVTTGLVRTGEDSMKYAVLASPTMLGEGLTMWLFRKEHRPRSPLGRAAIPGPVYAGVSLGMAGVCIVLLGWRYARIRP